MSQDYYQLLFESRIIINDDRMESSKREWNFNDGKLNYEMFMGTKTVKQQQLHLSAYLIKEM